MTWNDLTSDEQGFYQWFYEKKCNIWERGCCPIVSEQCDTAQREAPMFYPEPISGQPRQQNIFFLAINPNQGRDKDDRVFCWNSEDNRGETVEDYANRYLQWYNDPNWPGHVNDHVTGGALGILLARNGQPVPDNFVVLPEFDEAQAAELRNVVTLNLAHCKCRDFAKHFMQKHNYERQRTFKSKCGQKTLQAILLWRPKVVVCFGKPVLWWLQELEKSGWVLDENSARARNIPVGHVGTLTGQYRGQDVALNLVFSPHPSRNQLEGGGGAAVVEGLRTVLG